MAGPRLIPPDRVAAHRRVWAYIDGARRAMDIDEARAAGLTIVDLSDDWVPYIFWSKTPGKEDHMPNTYMRSFVRLAGDEINLNGAELPRGTHNYLEPYGIPPSLSVLQRRYAEDAAKDCYGDLNYQAFADYRGPLRRIDAKQRLVVARRLRAARTALLQAKRASGISDLDRLEQNVSYAPVVRRFRRWQWRHQAMREIKRRLVCEGVLTSRRRRISASTMRQAIRQFERKHHIYGWGMIYRDTAAALSRSALENNYRSLQRVISERVVGAAGILEDGTAGSRSYVAADGTTRSVRNLVQEFVDATLRHLGLTSAEQARAFMQHPPTAFSRFFVAVPLPRLPEYYSDVMQLRVVIDRGDVWYDLPFDEKGKWVSQPRKKRPRFWLYTDYRGQAIPLVRWKTTIGGWNKEMRDGEEYYKYKVSDVGPRIWQHIVAGPVWVPPKATPSHDMVKWGKVKHRRHRVVAHSTFGPGYASAYGLAAAFHVRKSDGFDNQIRTHGSVNYMSILSRYSHGCHRLFNYLAVRLFSFVLRHRHFERKGQSKLSYSHRFEHKGEEYQINLHTRGYYYELTPPMDVQVLEGRIRGERKEPYEEYVKKPGNVYQDDLPGGRSGGGTMHQPQTL